MKAGVEHSGALKATVNSQEQTLVISDLFPAYILSLEVSLGLLKFSSNFTQKY